jgi:hypothetical protein
MKMLNSVRLSDNQKRVIAKIIAAPTPKVAAEEISNGANLKQARDALVDLQLVTVALNDHAELTDKGRQLAQEENLADESGQLTPDGEKWAYTDEYGGEDTEGATPPEADQSGVAPGAMDPMADPAMGQAEDPLMMSYSGPAKMPLLRELLVF